MRKAVFGILLALLGAACSGRASSPAPAGAPEILIHPSSSPFTRVTFGEVQGLVPDGWQPAPIMTDAGYRTGIMASPKPSAWANMDGSAAGLSATWVDATQIGVPSDFYYLAATGPLLSRLTRSKTCTTDSQEIFLNDRPAFFQGRTGSPGDYMARGEGTCVVRGRPTRWAYFVAAPGFGPVRRLGIPQSGLYVVVAVVPESRWGQPELNRLIAHASFGGTYVGDFVAAARHAVD